MLIITEVDSFTNNSPIVVDENDSNDTSSISSQPRETIFSNVNLLQQNICPVISENSIIGLVLVKDLLPHVNEKRTVDEISIGTIILTDIANTWTMKVHQLRQLIVQQKIFNIDNNYIFLSNIGTPISINQEFNIELKYLLNTNKIIKFKRYHSLVGFSVIGLYSRDNGFLLGNVCAAYDTNLKQLRTKVDEILKDAISTNTKLTTNYQFVHSLFYPIHRNNEVNVTLIEIIRNNSIQIQFEIPIELDQQRCLELQDQTISTTYKYSSTDDLTGASNIEDQTDSVSGKGNKIVKKQTSFLNKRKVAKQKSMLKGAKKQIMLSYARQDAGDNAIRLKESLLKKGFSVYLDVHEIHMGSDWQDSLNNAVRNCNFFVPLITQNYGKTIWTNREVKLADLLNKHIIPINFLEFWPPECLAIQFATTQYIPCKLKISEHEADDSRNYKDDSKRWDDESLEMVSLDIVKFINELPKKEVKIRAAPSKDLINPVDQAQKASNAGSDPTKKPLIVISAHPDQHQIIDEIKSTLLADYDVWCSTDIQEVLSSNFKQKDDFISSSTYDQNLSPIIEENSTLTHATQDYARKIAENSKQRPKSVPNPESSELAKLVDIKKKDLGRVMSYNEGQHFSSISPDKLDRLKSFQTKVLLSELVIIVASEQYYNSRTSEQHVYYCGQRKKTILVKCDKSPTPVWFSKLMCQDNPLIYEKNDCSNRFESDLKGKIDKMLDPKIKYMEDIQEMKIKYLTDCMKKNMPNLETCVYVFGTDDLTNPRTVEICEEIGKELAQVKNINIVTNGFFGSGDLVAHTFVQERKSMRCDDSVVHIVPLMDSGNYRDKCRQNKDKTFDKVTYGQTLFFGESIKERDSVLARLLDTSILIGGDEYAAHETEEFIWNDHFVIPVQSTGGAAAGEFNVPQKIFRCPNGVRETEWEILSKSDAAPNEVAKAVVRVIYDLKKAIHEHAHKNTTNISKQMSDKPIKKRTAMRKRININVNQKLSAEDVNIKQIEPNSPEKLLPIFTTENNGDSGTNGKKTFKQKLNFWFRQLIL